MLLRVGRPLLVAHIVMVTVISFRVDNYRSLAPSWTASVSAARADCADLPPDEVVRIPQDPLPFWVVQVPCRDL